MHIVEDKQRLRNEAAARRDALPAARRAALSAGIAGHGLAFLSPTVPSVVSGYHTTGSEADCLPLLEALAAAGHVTALPVVAKRDAPLLFRAWQPGETLVPGVRGIRVPAEEAEAVEPDILLVPLLAFDKQGYRLGYGGGYYDRTLAHLRARKRIVAVGVAFTVQEVTQVPHAGHDERLDWVLTEDGPMKTGET